MSFLKETEFWSRFALPGPCTGNVLTGSDRLEMSTGSTAALPTVATDEGVWGRRTPLRIF